MRFLVVLVCLSGCVQSQVEKDRQVEQLQLDLQRVGDQWMSIQDGRCLDQPPAVLRKRTD